MVPTPEPYVFSVRCPSRPILDLVADKWTALILFALSDGKKRHGELKRKVGGISQKMLTQTLRELERYGLLTRTVLPSRPPMVEYELTTLGLELGTLVASLCEWTQKHSKEMNEAKALFDDRKELDEILKTPFSVELASSH
jgi:DNA-binding HxlR family transcriptional regulator